MSHTCTFSQQILIPIAALWQPRQHQKLSNPANQSFSLAFTPAATENHVVNGLKEYDRRIKSDKSQMEAFLHVFGVPCMRETLRVKHLILENVKEEELYNKFLDLGKKHAHLKELEKACIFEVMSNTDSQMDTDDGEDDGDVTSKGTQTADRQYEKQAASEAHAEGTCPVCEEQLPQQPSPHLQKLLKLFKWYDKGNAPSMKCFEEHCNLLCIVHTMETHAHFRHRTRLNWPTKLDKAFLGNQVLHMQDFCANIITSARANQQYCDIDGLLEEQEPHVIDDPAPMMAYLDDRGWLRSAG
ncbi:hypothetical protein K439DRAFT_1622237 [Ramaria rubella]|nr:hypothetical protein K439DRAFT_1622237 [Ramaria rubella]